MNCKALSVMPPWSDHIIHGKKRIENRFSRTKHRGVIAIHSSTNYDLSAPPLPGRWLEIGCRKHKGHIIGVARLVDCITPVEALRRFPEQKTWINTEPGTWCWVLEDPRPLISPVKHRGYPWIFGVEIPDDLLPEAYRG